MCAGGRGRLVGTSRSRYEARVARFLGLLSALGILLAIWVLLAGVGFIAGAIPPGGEDRGGSEPGETRAPGEEGPDSGVTETDGGVPLATDDAGDALDAGRGEGRAPDALRLRGYAACGGAEVAARAPVLLAAHVTGDPRPELLLGCGPRFELLAIDAKDAGAEGPVLGPVRVATFTTQVAEGVDRVEAGRPAAGDVDGDTLADLVLPFYGLADDGGTRGGQVYLVRRQAAGAFEAPRALAPLAAVDAVLAELDGHEGIDLVAMNRTRTHSRLRSEAWVFGGGASPSRTSVLRTGLGGASVAVAVLDADGHGDVVAVVADDPRIDVFMGDGAGRFPRSSSVAVAGGRRAVSADVDGDGHTDVLVQAEGLHLLRGGAAETLEPVPIDAPAGLREVAVLDVDRDGAADVVGIGAERIVWLRQTGPLTFEEGSLLAVLELRPERFSAADFDGDGKLDLAVLGQAGADATRWELLLVSDVRGAARAASPTGSAEIPDAPLSLRIPLP